MTSVFFSNPGLIPLEAITTLGINAKESTNPLGFFGTGLKYAIASILRTGQSITIYRGLDPYTFTLSPEEVRGKSFNFIDMSGPAFSRRLGFTDELGKTWEPWMLFRELYSNVLDEGGTMSFSPVDPAPSTTLIVVTGSSFREAALAKDEIFLPSAPVFTHPALAIHPGSSSHIFYRGVRVATLERPSLFTYNILGETHLTEDRTLKYSWTLPEALKALVCSSKTFPVAFAKKILKAREGAFEATLSWTTPFHRDLALALREELTESPTAYRPQIVALIEQSLGPMEMPSAKLTALESRSVTSAWEFLAATNLVSRTYPIKVVNNLGPGVVGMAKNSTIFLAKQTLDRGFRFITSTIYEEYCHLRYGFMDESREFQDFLLDKLIHHVAMAKDLGAFEPEPSPEPSPEPIPFPF